MFVRKACTHRICLIGLIIRISNAAALVNEYAQCAVVYWCCRRCRDCSSLRLHRYKSYGDEQRAALHRTNSKRTKSQTHDRHCPNLHIFIVPLRAYWTEWRNTHTLKYTHTRTHTYMNGIIRLVEGVRRTRCGGGASLWRSSGRTNPAQTRLGAKPLALHTEIYSAFLWRGVDIQHEGQSERVEGVRDPLRNWIRRTGWDGFDSPYNIRHHFSPIQILHTRCDDDNDYYIRRRRRQRGCTEPMRDMCRCI